MADDNESLGEREDGVVAAGVSAAVNAPSWANDEDIQLDAELREVTTVLVQQGQAMLARLIAVLLQVDLSDDAMWTLAVGELSGVLAGDHGDPGLSELDRFYRSIREHVLSLEEAGYEDEISEQVFPHLVLRAAQQAAGLIPRDVGGGGGESQPYRNGGFGAVPASAAAVHSLEKETFRAGAGADQAMGCSICVEEFVDGEQVSVMPCPSRGHRFHPDCIAKWLGMSNMCPLCRHQLPVYWCA